MKYESQQWIGSLYSFQGSGSGNRSHVMHHSPCWSKSSKRRLFWRVVNKNKLQYVYEYPVRQGMYNVTIGKEEESFED